MSCPFIKNEMECPGVAKEKSCGIVEFPRDVTQFHIISRGETLVSLEFPRVKLKNSKIPGFFKKVSPQPSLLVFFFLE